MGPTQRNQNQAWRYWLLYFSKIHQGAQLCRGAGHANNGEADHRTQHSPIAPACCC